mgnify:CR=1 FL=1
MPLPEILRRTLAACATLLLLLLAAETRADGGILFVSISPVPAGKFKKIAEIGAAQGFRVEHRQAEKLPPEPNAGI